ncbi:MAG: phosphate ABC transporter substrate-binding protein PstS [Roseateles asaccharophilus]|uniref:Phosphate-binding protein PstS n=1 Tax=Roseateles asaccharophilus TaxID=582607 RepID=A0A4R6MW23_9BURK|nr:phosphate ABC transporter substrate-binding protein PstS [Roseateles asaccharophilus]MDN3544305.1 phosphate ABC transporter substrate-binding protein PstS [Roseateles asaccharophilus]TDP06386.1 phosphate ABC transporter substrate-binding protein (PhoT family) [Roseateles asaccharophilus]
MSDKPYLRRRAWLRQQLLLPLLSSLGGAAALIHASSARAQATGAQAVNGSGASFPSLVYQRWAASYLKATGHQVSYQPTGSGEGQRLVSARQVHFGGSDSPLPPEELSKRELIQMPMLVGGIVPVVNLPGLSDARLRLSGPVLAALMSGEIERWNDAQISALNPGLSLPALPVRRVVRADKSGTSEGFTQYLSTVSPGFAKRVGASSQPKWPGEVESAEGNDGVVKALKARAGTLTYVSYDRVQRDRLSSASLLNAAGQWVSAGEAGFRSAIANSDVARKGDDRASLMNREGAESWPITMTSFILIDARPPSGAAATPVLRFLYWCLMHGDELLRGTGFAPLPIALQSKLAARLSLVKPRDNKPPVYQSA